jgi:hypothetical protein
MIVEIRRGVGHPPFLVLIPNEEELLLVEEVLGKVVVDADGLIASVKGQFRLTDGYGTAYLSIRSEEV